MFWDLEAISFSSLKSPSWCHWKQQHVMRCLTKYDKPLEGPLLPAGPVYVLGVDYSRATHSAGLCSADTELSFRQAFSCQSGLLYLLPLLFFSSLALPWSLVGPSLPRDASQLVAKASKNNTSCSPPQWPEFQQAPGWPQG